MGGGRRAVAGFAPLTVSAPIILDVNRLIWRRWRGSLPTGVDRVCLAYVEHFGARARAVVRFKGRHLALSPCRSRALFALLLEGGPDFRKHFVTFVARAILPGSWGRVPAGAFYLNVGHTGLEDPDLATWVERHRLRAIYLVHDLIPLTHPQYCRPDEDEKHGRRMRTILASAAGVIGNSQATLDDLAAFAAGEGMAMPPTVVAWLSGQAIARPSSSAVAGRPYFLVLGTIEGRKNHRLLLEVWRGLHASLGDKIPRLVIVGARGWEADDVFAQLDDLGPLAPFIDEKRHCSDAELAELMAGARALLMPSFAEGYGMPVFEALEFGTPVIAADLPVYHEVAGDIPTYLDPDDADAWARVVIRYCEDDPERARQIGAMRSFQVPDWAAHFAVVDRWMATLD
ncbi:glycosyltransferase family 1 protein [Sphingomonas kaistensis]|uniref:Glycosyltransferase family 1 protein n=1 Tax=Sphingomonas kaistensis TaxID=298708 RepID=A0ABZ2G0B7_9SPHN